MSPLVSIVVLNWNGDRHVHRCIDHVVAQTYSSLEIIVVDNGSKDGSLERIKNRFPQFRYIENEVNLGYAKGMNQGIRAAAGEFIVPLGQDVCLDTHFVEECIRRAEKGDERLGVIGGRVLSWVGDELTSQIKYREGEDFRMRKRFQGDGGNFTKEEMWTFAPTGSFPFFRTATLNDIEQATGYVFDEAFGSGWEDADLFFRLHLRGWKCLFLPSAVGWHAGSGSVGGKQTLLSKPMDYQTRILRNRYFTIVKNLPVLMLLWLSPYLAVTEIAIPPYFLFKSPRTVISLIDAWGQIIREMPVLLRKRSLIQRTSRVKPLYLKQFFVRF